MFVYGQSQIRIQLLYGTGRTRYCRSKKREAVLKPGAQGVFIKAQNVFCVCNEPMGDNDVSGAFRQDQHNGYYMNMKNNLQLIAAAMTIIVAAGVFAGDNLGWMYVVK